MQQLREDWQNQVVQQLMSIKDTYGVPLARRQRDQQVLEEMRSAGAVLASDRVGIKQAAAEGQLAPAQPVQQRQRLHVVSQDMLRQGVRAAVTGKPLPSCTGDNACQLQVQLQHDVQYNDAMEAAVDMSNIA